MFDAQMPADAVEQFGPGGGEVGCEHLKAAIFQNLGSEGKLKIFKKSGAGSCWPVVEDEEEDEEERGGDGGGCDLLLAS